MGAGEDSFESPNKARDKDLDILDEEREDESATDTFD